MSQSRLKSQAGRAVTTGPCAVPAVRQPKIQSPTKSRLRVAIVPRSISVIRGMQRNSKHGDSVRGGSQMYTVARPPHAVPPREALTLRLREREFAASGPSASEYVAGSGLPPSFSKRCVPVLRKVEPGSVALAYGSSPKHALSRVFTDLRRAARLKMSARISERLAGPGRRQRRAVDPSVDHLICAGLALRRRA